VAVELVEEEPVAEEVQPRENDAPDEELVDEATTFIREAIRKTVERGMLEIGEYLFRKFFDADPDVVRQKSCKTASFRALLDRCDTLELPLGKTALYTAVSVAAMQHQLGAGGTAFKQLPHSHQVALLPVRDPKKVEKLATRALSKKLPVRALREEVAEERAAATEGEKRGRKPDPTLVKALKRATAAFTVEGRLRQVTKAQVEELSEEQLGEVKKMAAQLQALVEALGAKLQ
jgi:hypothetical protein